MADTQLHTDIAGLRADLQATNRNVERIANSLEKTLVDHESRLRVLETSRSEAKGSLKFITWGLGFVGFPTLCLIIYMVATKGH